MKPLCGRTRRVTFRIGIIVFAAMVVLSSTPARHVGLAVLAASVAGLPTRTTAATADHNGTSIRSLRISAPDAALAELRRRVLATRWLDKDPSLELVNAIGPFTDPTAFGGRVQSSRLCSD